MVLSRILGTAFAAFIVLGTPKSAFGVAWPSISDDLDRQIAELGVALIAHATGYFVASMANGEVTRRLGVGACAARPILCCRSAGMDDWERAIRNCEFTNARIDERTINALRWLAVRRGYGTFGP